jgi:hypothetical protein
MAAARACDCGRREGPEIRTAKRINRSAHYYQASRLLPELASAIDHVVRAPLSASSAAFRELGKNCNEQQTMPRPLHGSLPFLDDQGVGFTRGPSQVTLGRGFFHSTESWFSQNCEISSMSSQRLFSRSELWESYDSDAIGNSGYFRCCSASAICQLFIVHRTNPR